MLVQSNIAATGHDDSDPESHSVLWILWGRVGVGGLVTELRVIHQTSTLPLGYTLRPFTF